MSEARILVGDARVRLAELADGSVQTCITSPPYFGLRDYGHGDQMGLEATPDEYVKGMVALFREVWRVLADDGTLWLNLGDSYSGSGKGGQSAEKRSDGWQPEYANKGATYGLKPKDLIGIPWRVAFALQADGWYLRQDIIWAKPNPMPESVTDRCTKSHEYLFLLSKSARYCYDHEAIKEPSVALSVHDQTGTARTGIPGQSDHTGNRDSWHGSRFDTGKTGGHQIGRAQPGPARSGNKERKSALSGGAPNDGVDGNVPWVGFTRNKRDVWTIPTKPFRGAHFAVMPEALVEPCVLAGSREGDTLLDPFVGSGTVGVVALRHQRNFVGVELNPVYAEMARRRIADYGPMLNIVKGDADATD